MVGELAIGAARLGLWDRVARPASWATWCGPWASRRCGCFRCGGATDDREAAVRRAAEVEATKPVHPRLGALAEAARTWVAILGGTAEPAAWRPRRRLQGLG